MSTHLILKCCKLRTLILQSEDTLAPALYPFLYPCLVVEQRDNGLHLAESRGHQTGCRLGYSRSACHGVAMLSIQRNSIQLYMT